MIRVVLLDDEEHAIDNLAMMLRESGQVEVVSTSLRPAMFFAELKRLEADAQLPDAAFIDIEMPEMNGLEAAEKVKERYPQIDIVFVTAYSEYAIQAFELHSLDYVLKPPSRKRLAKTLSRLAAGRGDHHTEGRDGGGGELHFRTMGDFAVLYRGESERLRWRTGKVKELCAILLHDAHRAIPAHELMERLFPEIDQEKAKVLLYTSVSYLRKSFKEFGFPHIIRNQDGGYRLQLDKGMRWDAMELEAALEEPVRTGDAAWFQQLSQLYQGEYLKDFEQPKFVAKRLELRRRMEDVLRDVRERCRLAGDSLREADCLFLLLQAAPESEELAFELIQIYADQGRRDEALRVYHRFAHYLKEELDLEPGPGISAYVQERLLSFR